MKKLFFIIMFLISTSSSAGTWTAGYMLIDGDVGGLTAEYSNSMIEDSKWDFSAGVLIGTKDYGECSSGVCAIVEIDPSPFVRSTYSMNENFFIRATAASFQFSATAAGYGQFAFESGSQTELGLGIGFNAGSVSFAIDGFDGASALSLAYNF